MKYNCNLSYHVCPSRSRFLYFTVYILQTPEDCRKWWQELESNSKRCKQNGRKAYRVQLYHEMYLDCSANFCWFLQMKMIGLNSLHSNRLSEGVHASLQAMFIVKLQQVRKENPRKPGERKRLKKICIFRYLDWRPCFENFHDAHFCFLSCNTLLKHWTHTLAFKKLWSNFLIGSTWDVPKYYLWHPKNKYKCLKLTLLVLHKESSKKKYYELKSTYMPSTCL